jgi:hypothetical protein
MCTQSNGLDFHSDAPPSLPLIHHRVASTHCDTAYSPHEHCAFRNGIAMTSSPSVTSPSQLILDGAHPQDFILKKNSPSLSIFLDTEFQQIYTFVSCKLTCCSIDV